MRISLLSLPKDRQQRVPNDDAILVLPKVLGVFDGATSPQGQASSVSSSGYLASQAAAQAVARLAEDDALLTLAPADIFAAISARIRVVSEQQGMTGKPSTTMALAVFGADEARLLLIGDSSVRLNGAQLIQRKKPIDEVSTRSRLAVHQILSLRHPDADELETLLRLVAFGGYTEAMQQAILTPREVSSLRELLVQSFNGLTDSDTLIRFLDQGIRSQYVFANRTDHPLGYSTLNSDTASLTDIIDMRLPLADLNSIELFSDGYFLLPDAVSVSAWEQAFAQSEAEDFHKLHRFANVKGSTGKEFADDRSVIVADTINGSGAL